MLTTGIAIGIVLTLLVFVILFLLGQNAAYRGQVRVLAKEQGEAESKLQFLAGSVQKMQQPIVFNLTDDQITTLAAKVTTRVQTMMNAATEEALKKMN